MTASTVWERFCFPETLKHVPKCWSEQLSRTPHPALQKGDEVRAQDADARGATVPNDEIAIQEDAVRAVVVITIAITIVRRRATVGIAAAEILGTVAENTVARSTEVVDVPAEGSTKGRTREKTKTVAGRARVRETTGNEVPREPMMREEGAAAAAKRTWERETQTTNDAQPNLMLAPIVPVPPSPPNGAAVLRQGGSDEVRVSVIRDQAEPRAVRKEKTERNAARVQAVRVIHVI